MEQLFQSGTCYRATFDVQHYQATGEIVYTSPVEPYQADYEPEIMEMLQNGDIGPKRLTYLLNSEKFLHIARQTRMTDARLAMYFGCSVDVIRAFKRRYMACTS